MPNDRKKFSKEQTVIIAQFHRSQIESRRFLLQHLVETLVNRKESNDREMDDFIWEATRLEIEALKTLIRLSEYCSRRLEDKES